MTSDHTPTVKLLPTNVESRERIPGSSLVPGGATWSEDSRLAVVSDSSILVATFRSRELEMFQPCGPAVSKDFVFLPDNPINEHVPVAIPPVIESLDAGLPRASTTYFLLNESDRHQHNPKELSLSKNTGAAFIAAVWGPRGSAPNNSCALLALTASSRLSLHFPPGFHMNWREVAVLSESVYTYFYSKSFRLGPSHDNRYNTVPLSTAMAAHRGDKMNKKRKKNETTGCVAMNSIAEYTHQCALMSTLTMAWSPFMVTVDRQKTTSLIAMSGRKVSTIWAYKYRSFVAEHETEPFLSTSPIAWIDTDKYGWVLTSTWQQMHRYGTAFTRLAQLCLALGTSEGNVLIVKAPVKDSTLNGAPEELGVERVIVSPCSQPVYGLCMGSRWTYSNSLTNDLVVASGSTISVWNLLKKKQVRPNAKWKAHDGNVTGLDINYFGDAILSAAVDGTIKVWRKTSELVYSSDVTLPKITEVESSIDTSTSRALIPGQYPVFALAMSPSSALLACVFIVPPASRPNRKSQADVSYSRVSSLLEYIPLPWMKSPDQLVDVVCRILNECQSVSSFMDVVWLCYNDNAAVMSFNSSTDLAIPNVLNIKKDMNESKVLARQPIYLYLCQELEKKYHESTSPRDKDVNPSIPLYLQASLLLRSVITPADHQVAAQNAALVKLRRILSVYWAKCCLTALVVASGKKNKVLSDYLDSSSSEKLSALMMADFLSAQDPSTQCSEALVTKIYSQLDSPERAAAWTAYVMSKGNEQTADGLAVAIPVPLPPSRETCFLCQKSVPFGELEIACESGHMLERCFLSFRCISTMDVWKCTGCGASASRVDVSSSTTPFYILNSEDHHEEEVAASTKIICRLCGSYCSFLKY